MFVKYAHIIYSKTPHLCGIPVSQLLKTGVLLSLKYTKHCVQSLFWCIHSKLCVCSVCVCSVCVCVCVCVRACVCVANIKYNISLGTVIIISVTLQNQQGLIQM